MADTTVSCSSTKGGSLNHEGQKSVCIGTGKKASPTERSRFPASLREQTARNVNASSLTAILDPARSTRNLEEGVLPGQCLRQLQRRLLNARISNESASGQPRCIPAFISAKGENWSKE
jgi:hypothetical protein